MRQTAHGLRSRFHDRYDLPPAWRAVYNQTDKELAKLPRLTQHKLRNVRHLLHDRYTRCPDGLADALRAYLCVLTFLDAYASQLERQAYQRHQKRNAA